MKRTPKAVCLFSGGPDSAAAAAVARSEGFDLYLLFVDYGQKTRKKERACSEKLAAHLATSEFRTVDARWLGEFGGSALVDSHTMLTQVNAPLEYVPFRNTILLSIGVAWAEVLQAAAVFIGSTGGPWHTPDNSPEYVSAMQEVVRIGTKLKTDIQLRAPFCKLTKKETVEIGLNLQVPFELTWSCHNSETLACGQCSNCRDRIRAFELLGRQDPIPYAC